MLQDPQPRFLLPSGCEENSHSWEPRQPRCVFGAQSWQDFTVFLSSPVFLLIGKLRLGEKW